MADLNGIVQRMIDAGESEDNIASVIREFKPVASHEPATPAERTWTDTAIDTLPTIGGVAGGLIGGAGGTVLGMGVGGAPGAVGGAALGGMAGEGIREAVQTLRGKEKPRTTGEALADVGTQGAVQAGSEVGGRVLGAGLRTVAKPLYQSILKPSKMLRGQYPGLVTNAIEAGIPVSRGGATKAEGLIESSRDAADALVATRQASPIHQRLPGATTIDPKQAVGGITQAVNDVKDLPVARPQMQAIGDYGRAYLREHPAPMSLTKAQTSVRATDRFYDDAYRKAIDKGDPIKSGQASAAVGINDATRNLLRDRVPGLKTQNAKTSAMVGVKKAVSERVDQRANNSAVGMQHLINAGIGGSVGAYGGKEKGIGSFALAEALTNPAIASRLAIAAGKAGSSGASAQALRQALISLMASHSTGDSDGR